MYEWGFIFLFFATIAAAFGFTGIAASIASIATVLFYLFVFLSLLFFLVAFLPQKKININGLMLDME